MRQVEENGIDFVPNSDPILLLEANGSSDGLVVEGQSIIWNSEFGYYYMIFSANGFASPYYHVGVARSGKVKLYKSRYLLHFAFRTILI